MQTSSKHHSFDIEIAAQYGIEEAIIIHHFQHWISVNEKLNRNFIEGRTWTYQTQEEIAAHFPYLNKRKVKYTIERLIKKEILLTGNFNKKKMDKTLWYTFKNKEILTKDKIVPSKDKIVPPIPESKPESKPDSYKDNVKRETMTQAKAKEKTLDFSKRFNLSDEELEKFDWLKSQNIDTDDPTLCFWSKSYTLKRLIEVYKEAKKYSKKSVGGYMTKLLKSGSSVQNDVTQANKEFAEEFKKDCEWSDLKIMKKYCKVVQQNGYEHEVDYKLPKDEFKNKIYELYKN